MAILLNIVKCACAYGRACGRLRERTCVREGAHPPKLNGCGKLQICILSGKKLENSSTHDFA